MDGDGGGGEENAIDACWRGACFREVVVKVIPRDVHIAAVGAA